MRYLKDLIPPEHRVMPDYFQQADVKTKSVTTRPSLLSTLISIVFFIATVYCFDRPLIALLLMLGALLYTSKGKNWLEKKAEFRLTNKIRIGIHVGLLVFCLPLLFYYQRLEEQNTRMAEQAKRQRIKIVADSVGKDNLRKDSLDYFLKRMNIEDPQKSFALLKLLDKYSISQKELDTAKKLRRAVSRRFAKSLLKKGRNREALDIYNGLLAQNSGDADLLYDRASYYLKIGKIKLAVHDLSSSMEAGSNLASKMYNKVNPIKRKVAYYVTRCCDGTTSNATGRGACSWHGGVCKWNDPVYEEYRKY
jgi:tetratricopeptide (TPR) repeat protein